ncbi:septum site-determining protein Ssd [Solicola gregarius]|uniref:CpaE-like family protein n=1 Tax=Solicola gregarius TaxID=2908642 RepID=A0AA46TE07_9ACTN|nr:septum site-determining protein Ssd [Solicola gregarius]UYM03365.1 CpaE-like family protein [Solicola gregarius]
MTFIDAVPRPLVVTSDPAMLDELLRLCAAAGVTPEVASDAAQARRSWSSAPCVVVGPGHVDSLARTVDRRDGVVIVAERSVDPALWERAVDVGAEGVFVLPDDESAVVDLLAASTDRSDGEASVVAVVGGTGGCGASTLATGLAVSVVHDGHSAMLVDADPLGGGIDMLVGTEDAEGLRWPDLAVTHGRVSGASLRQVLPRTSGLSVLSWGTAELDAVPREAMSSVLSAGRRSHDLVVVDVPRWFDEAAEEALVRASCAVLIVSAEIRAIAAAQRVLARLRPLCADVRLVVRLPGPAGLRADVVGRTMALPLTATTRTDRRLAEMIDNGFGPFARRRGPLGSACSSIIEALDLPGTVAA